MQRRVEDQTSLLPHRSHFDMWHDYMDLGRLLQQLCGSREMETRATSGPKTVLKAPWGQQLATHREEDLNISIESIHLSSDSSLSDTSCSVTSLDYCRFCKQNGESAVVYRSHKLKSPDGKVTCPILWNYTCPICDATGDNAHTRRYCPQAQRNSAGMTPPRSKFW